MVKKPQGHKWFSAFWALMVRMEPASERRVRQDIAGGAKGRVLEIGCGVGANFPYFGDAVEHVVAIDPDPYMLERARKRAAKSNRSIEVRQAAAEDLPFEAASFDTVVSTLNMCTIADPMRALAEIKRVLRPGGGEYRFYDHVRYDHAFGAFWQDLVAPVWRWCGAGCNPNRDIAEFIRRSGFEFERLEFLREVPPVPPMSFVRPHIKGVARPV